MSESGSESSPVRTVEPVVVRPDTDSNMASVNDKPGKTISSGRAAAMDVSTQAVSQGESRLVGGSHGGEIV